MSLSPKDINEQTFRVTFRGFDPVEVDAFLKRVADEVERLIEEKNNLDLDLDVERASRKSLEETLEATSHIQTALLEKSREEGRLIVERARLEAERVRDASVAELAELTRQIVAAKERRAFALSELSALSHGVGEWVARFERDFGVEGQAAFDARLAAFSNSPAPAAVAEPKPSTEPWEEMALETTAFAPTRTEAAVAAAGAAAVAVGPQGALALDDGQRDEGPEGFVLQDDRSTMFMDIMGSPEAYTPPDMRGADPKRKVKVWETSQIERPAPEAAGKAGRGPEAFSPAPAGAVAGGDEEAIEIIEDFTGEEQ